MWSNLSSFPDFGLPKLEGDEVPEEHETKHNPWGPTDELDPFFQRPKDSGVFGFRREVRSIEDMSMASCALYTLTIEHLPATVVSYQIAIYP